MRYKPINDTSTIEVVKSANDQSLSDDKKVVRDPKNQISPRVYGVIRTEKIIKITNLSISYSLMLASIVLFILSYFNIWIFKNNIGYLILYGVSAFIFLALGTKNLIENIQWTNTIHRYRDAISRGESTSSSTFHLAYRQIVLKSVNLTWILIFILTYMGIFTAIIYGLYSTKSWQFHTQELAGSHLSFKIDWVTILDKTFKNTNVFCLICVIIMASVVVFYVTMRLIDKKRLADLNDYLGEKSVEIHEQIEKARKDRNKAWLIAYIVVVVLTILLPLALALVAIWRLVRKRRLKIG
ncbi:hypothetical protein MCAL160_0518 [Mycoplasmopsis californica HAZ160_1]|uniref:Membrane protein n=2 Tax=Mycoplasmopsis californica TaxID=2113 RepID=A0A059XW75_9BACT|nr:hypothetical protein [Mycoplasmopsis californica]AIA29492.1 membrane protein [Mycoplasmopsis californica]BAP01064.1 hypothetical protein MCAL160_0518 [Mycoplasmopsis californica HAZ160_1]BBG40929.1 hypothetical protein MCAL106_0518 [Mycoplasmopsis californica]BBG41523.1 hypothetical protein MCAL106E_0518 [Mycoplasmopsis californica]BBG42116.1 hypothetical protein MCAL106L_0518 [Mycoplasmopsis californica]